MCIHYKNVSWDKCDWLGSLALRELKVSSDWDFGDQLSKECGGRVCTVPWPPSKPSGEEELVENNYRGQRP